MQIMMQVVFFKKIDLWRRKGEREKPMKAYNSVQLENESDFSSSTAVFSSIALRFSPLARRESISCALTCMDFHDRAVLVIIST